MQSEKFFQIVICVDVPDPDNIAMILYIFAVYEGRVAIILSPRIVDLSVARYGEEFPEMVETLGFKTMYEPIKENQTPTVRQEWEDFFEPDRTLLDRKVVKDTELYMRVSKMRIVECIEEQHPGRNNYEIFWDPESLRKIKEPDMRHALHVADYAFNFDDTERDEYQEIIKKPSGPILRKSLRRLCRGYIGRIKNVYPYPTAEISNIKRLFKDNSEVEGATLVVGGPFTEALQYIEKTRSRPKKVFAMKGTLTRDRNTADRPQFNIAKDAESAYEFLNKVSHEEIPMFITPTECCKEGDPQNPCPYALQEHEYKELFKNSPLMLRIVGQWLKERGATQFLAFDLIAAIPMEEKIFDWVKVKYKACKTGKVVKDIKFSTTKKQSCINMAKADYELMSERKEIMHKQVKRAFPRDWTLPTGE